MTIEELKKYIDIVDNTNFEDINSDELIGFAARVIEEFDDKKGSRELVETAYTFIMKYFHKYAENTYDHETKFEIKDSHDNSHYTPNADKIQYSKSYFKVHMYPAIWNAFDVLHENRHGVQWQQYRMEPDQILNIDPISIITLKELLLTTYNRDIYDNNHHDMIVENDASLCAYNTLHNFISRYMPNKEKYLKELDNKGKGEIDNYTFGLREGILDNEFSNLNEGRLSVIFEEDKEFKKHVSPEWIKQYPLLKLICKDDGTPKSYKELNEDKERYLKEHERKTIRRNDSLSNFEGFKGRPASEHIHTIYTLIINSDPMLYLENCMNFNKRMNIKTLFSSNPELFDFYGPQIPGIVNRYINIDNYAAYEELFDSLGKHDISAGIDRRVDNVIIRGINKMYGMSMDSTKDSDGEVYKTVTELEAEKSEILSRLESSYRNQEISEKDYNEYVKRVSKLYKEYNRESLENDPNQSMGQNDPNQNLGQENEIIEYNDRILALIEKYKCFGFTYEEIEEMDRRLNRDIEKDKDIDQEDIEGTGIF